MTSVRSGAAAAQLQHGNILVTGGFDGSYLNSAEMLTERGWESNIPPITICGHCMVTVNSTTVMVIGGYQNNQGCSGKTFYFTLGEESWIEGPELKNKRVAHSCGRIKRDEESQKMSIIVAGGGFGQQSFLTVEILDEGYNEWQTGPELPFGIIGSQMVEDRNGGILLIGGDSSSSILNTLYHLPHGGQDAVWTEMEQKMLIGRHYHTAFLVPDNVVDCS
jgi:hypothetical protein